MNDDLRAAQVVEDLDVALHADLGLRRAGDLGAFVADGDDCRYLVRPRVRMASHFDLTPAFLIFDPLLGTLGIVQLALAGEGTARDAISALVRRHIDQAAYVRHLLLRDRSVGDGRALTVELVLLTADETPREKRALNGIGAALRNVLRDTDSLFHIGVGLLSHGGGEKPFNGRLRRAFPWLLTATRQWLTSKSAAPPQITPAAPAAAPPQGDAAAGAAPPPANAAPAGATLSPANAASAAAPAQEQPAERRRLQRLRLTNYRLPGVRELVLANTRVHLLHGPNGSGKSTIVEALELLTSGTVERLQRASEQDYDSVIRHKPIGARLGDAGFSVPPATIDITWINQKKQSTVDDPRRVDTGGLERPLAPDVSASSFRLDQPLMDKLVTLSESQRADTFLRAFFPEAALDLSSYTQATATRTEKLAALGTVVQRLVAAKDALIALQSWRGGTSTVTTEEFSVVLNKWLERTALLDLAQRERIVRTTLQAADAEGWKPQDAASASVAAAFGAERDVAKFEAFQREGETAVNDLERKLASFKGATTAGAGAHAAPLLVTPPVVDTLNSVCRWLFSADAVASFGLLGDKVARVINAGDAPTYATIVIGHEGWAAPLLTDLDAMLNACSALTLDVAAPDWPGKTACAEFEEAKRAHLTAQDAGQKLNERFLSKLKGEAGVVGEFDRSLISALNEVIALFTPARWAYTDIQLPSELKDGAVSLPLHLGDLDNPSRAELHLNTAELNLFVVALFLLCAGRVRKPLNLLIFDDPLQNMDELTATALARGLAKIVRLMAKLGRDEELFLLFHGYGDLDRFRSEIAAATYRLPWLSPSRTQTTSEIKPDTAASDILAVQKITEFLAVMPERDARREKGKPRGIGPPV